MMLLVIDDIWKLPTLCLGDDFEWRGLIWWEERGRLL